MRNQIFHRRDFLKLAGTLPFGLSAARLTEALRLRTDSRKNVIIIVFDAWSARNVPLYGYSRNTTPFLNELARRATVYHNHYAGSNFTTSGTATLLTGTYPWTNRALESNGRVAEEFTRRSLFSVFEGYRRLAYSHNDWAVTLFLQFQQDIEELKPRADLFLLSSDMLIQSLFGQDNDISSVGWIRNAKIESGGYAYSLLLSRLISAFDYQNSEQYLARFPRGLPTYGSGFLLEDAIDWIAERAAAQTEPFCGYFHLLPPHAPYNTRGDFVGAFRRDGYQDLPKPAHIFAEGTRDDLLIRRRYYDEYILYVDSEFNRLFRRLEESGVLENSWLVLTSDHGESFERGINGHTTKALYEPLIHIPLLIFEPGQKERRDVYTPTSAADLPPTLAYLNGLPIPNWSEGRILPPYAPPEENRSIYAVYSPYTARDQPMRFASIALRKGKYKLHYYVGYPELERGELVLLYDLEADPEEMNDLSDSRRETAQALLRELKEELAKKNQPYLK